jgi:hypothetical protein
MWLLPRPTVMPVTFLKERGYCTILGSSAKHPRGADYSEEFLNMQALGASVELFLIITHSVCVCERFCRSVSRHRAKQIFDLGAVL